MKSQVVLLLFLIFFTSSVKAGNWSQTAEPTRIDIERGNGVMIYGAFGNAGECSTSNKVFIEKSHPQYDKVYAMVLAAFASNKKLRIYIHSCKPVTWYAVKETTFNTLTSAGAINILK
ncbi:DUF5992 family protein [Pseudoalteromonas prydzensis]|uniref:DUF5992 family protein n=1 Tax=Pseudoalteromonas prydzensis TaxID=182141 RepID=UPI0007E5181B|nr:DUF5992 family protein [Pseudoalteromonas prydzensis]MBE0380411.1 hypothetical protein [Pseudoalteromonas prydzensis ACAM 620]